MTLDGHIKTGLTSAIVFLSTLPGWLSDAWTQPEILISALILFIGNLAPDFLEMKIIRHRTYTHFIWYYLIIGAIAYFLGLSGLSLEPDAVSWWDPTWSLYILAFCLGCITHILADWPFYGGVPLFRPRSQVALTRITFESTANSLIEHSVVVVGLIVIVLTATSATA